jgi:hypothetical protein
MLGKYHNSGNRRLIMKRMMLLAVIGMAFVTVMPVVAQDSSSYYFVKVQIEKVYPYNRGYVVTYRKGVNKLVDTYLPIEWFSDVDRKEGEPPKGELILLNQGAVWPYLVVYYKDGAFSHVRLFVRKDYKHQTWGGIISEDIAERFDNVEEIKLEF